MLTFLKSFINCQQSTFPKNHILNLRSNPPMADLNVISKLFPTETEKAVSDN